MLKGSLIATLLILCVAAVGDSLEMGKKVYNDVLISGATREKIWFLQDGRVNTDRPAAEVTKITIDSFPEFNKAEELASQGQYEQAMPKYIEAYKAVDSIREAWRKRSLENLDKGNKELSETLDANAAGDWIKDLIKYRHARAKGLLSGEITTAAPDAKESPASSANGDAKFCSECRGKGKIKCARCNGSGKQKCQHMIDGEKHATYYEICAKCNGKGFELEHYQEWVPDEYRYGRYYRGGYYKDSVRKINCSGKGCKPFKVSPGKTIYVTWICPDCSNGSPVGYVDCPYCEKGRIECAKCNGSGKVANGSKPQTGTATATADVAAPAAEEDEMSSPGAMLNSIEKNVGEKLPKSPYKNYEGNELKKQKDREAFDQIADTFIVTAQKYYGKGATWYATVERVSKVKSGSFIITANFVRDNANADIWEIKAVIPSRYAEIGEKLSSNSPVEITGKITGIDFKYETITLNADELKIAD